MNNYKQYLIILLSLVICSVSFGQYFSMRIDSMTTVLEYECYVANWYYDSQLMETNNIAVIEDTIFQISYDDICEFKLPSFEDWKRRFYNES